MTLFFELQSKFQHIESILMSYPPFLKYTAFSTFHLYALTYRAEVLYVTFMCFNDCEIQFECRQHALHFVRVKPLFELTR